MTVLAESSVTSAVDCSGVGAGEGARLGVTVGNAVDGNGVGEGEGARLGLLVGRVVLATGDKVEGGDETN